MKKLSLLISFSFVLFFANNISAQDDANTGIIIDGIKADKINCWSFTKMDLIFPFDRTEWKKYDKVVLYLRSKNETSGFSYYIVVDLDQKQIEAYFKGDVKYVVWKIFRDKATDKVQTSYSSQLSGRKEISTNTERYYWAQVIGLTLNGSYADDGYGGKIAQYDQVILYKGPKIYYGKSKYKPNESCIVTGSKIEELKIEDAGGYREDLGIIKK